MKVPPDGAIRLLVLRFGSVGDVLLTTPALEALRGALPKAHIAYGVRGEFQALLQHNPHLDELIPLAPGEGVWPYARRLRAWRPDYVLDLQGQLRSRLLALLMPGVPFTVWHKRDLWETLRVRFFGQKPRTTLRIASRSHQAVEKLVGRSLPPGKLRTFVGPEDAGRAREMLAAAGVRGDRPMVGFSPGANWKTKQWPVEHYGELARLALSEGVQVVLVGSEGERPLGQAIAGIAPGVKDLCGVFDLTLLGGFLEACDAFVANDSGPMHLSRGLGVPTVALFGSTDPAMFEWEGHSLQWAGVDCAPCSFFGRSSCPKQHFRCMKDLAPAAVWEDLRTMLGSPRRALLSG